MSRSDRVFVGLRLYQEGNAISRERGFEILTSETAPGIKCYARKKGCTDAEAEDVALEVLEYIWEHPDLRFQEPGGWFSYIYKAATSKAQDLRNKRLRLLENGEGEIEDIQTESAKGVFEKALANGAFLDAADDLWLGPKPKDLTFRLLAAQLYCIDLPGQWQFACRVIARSPSGFKPSTEKELREWIADVRVVRATTYPRMYLKAPEITAHIVGCPVNELVPLFGKVPLSPLCDLAVGEWTWQDISVIQWKFFEYRPTSRVHENCVGNQTGAQIDAIVDRCVQCLPFTKVMEKIWREFEFNPTRDHALRESGLWKRLAVQFIISDDLPHKDFERWMTPAAKIPGFVFLPNTIHSWISNGLLMKELAKFLGVSYGEGGHA